MATDPARIDDTTLRRLLYLSRLAPESVDIPAISAQIHDIVGYFDILSRFAGEDTQADGIGAITSDTLRRDGPGDDSCGGDTGNDETPGGYRGLGLCELGAMSRDFLDGYFRVPKVLGGDD